MEVGVFAFVQNSEGKVLLGRDVTREQKWTLIGGGLEFQEIVTDAVKREVKEEAGVDVGVKQLSGVFSQIKSPGLVMLFDCSITSGTPVADSKEMAELRYFSWDELESIRNQVKPAQFSMIRQRLSADHLPIFNTFI